jgi:DeoR/GlpR family transcriptional regulator of sugar metabolism
MLYWDYNSKIVQNKGKTCKRGNMLSVERRQSIINILNRDGRVVVLALSQELDVSIDTVRRDLRDLAAEGRLQRVHGGALPASPASTSFLDRQRYLTDEKISIARRAAQLAQNGMVIAMGGGITNVQTAEHFGLDLKATVITHNPAVVMALAEHLHVEVILVGGKLLKYTMVTVGPETVEGFRRLRADLCFLGVCSLHPEVGISDIHYEEVQVQREMIACAGEVVALASSDKMGTASPFVIGPLTDVNLIITDKRITPESLAPYRNLGIEVIQA